MSNIVYGVQVIPHEEDDGTKVLDYNDMLDERIQEEAQKHNMEMAKEQARIKREEKLRELQEMEPQYDEDGNLIEPELPEDFDEEDFFEEDVIQNQEPDEDYVAMAREEAEEIIAQANAQAQDILDAAQSQANAMKSHAEAEGHQAGFDKGYQESIMKQTEMQADIEKQRQAMMDDIAEKEKNMEKELVDAVCGVVEKVFLAKFGDDKNIIFHLLDNVISNVDSSKSFIIRVNEQNMEFLRNKKDELQTKVGQEVSLDIVLDPLLNDSQCMVETDGGLFDCSMDTEMRNLIKEIKALS